MSFRTAVYPYCPSFQRVELIKSQFHAVPSISLINIYHGLFQMTSHHSELLGIANTCRSYHTQANYIVMVLLCIMQCYVCLPEVQPNIILIVADDMG